MEQPWGNTVIERKGAKTAFLTTEGFRDILEMGYEKRYDHYDIYLEKPPPLVPRKYRLPVRERISAEGKVLVELDQIRFFEIEAVAVGSASGSCQGIDVHSDAERLDTQQIYGN